MAYLANGIGTGFPKCSQCDAKTWSPYTYLSTMEKTQHHPGALRISGTIGRTRHDAWVTFLSRSYLETVLSLTIKIDIIESMC